MDSCYICSREGITKCSICYKTICRIHSEDEKGKDFELKAICTSCKKKRRLKRIQIYTILAFIIMAIGIVIGIVITSQTLWS
ncbi:MAG: hypothetical protein FK731_07110 [Asgard group archaeon]|nr:hypothetical protein [Asgard group archaeon]